MMMQERAAALEAVEGMLTAAGGRITPIVGDLIGALKVWLVSLTAPCLECRHRCTEPRGSKEVPRLAAVSGFPSPSPPSAVSVVAGTRYEKYLVWHNR